MPLPSTIPFHNGERQAQTRRRTPPKRAPLLIAAYYDAPQLSTNAREAVLQEVGSAFVTWASG